MVPTWVGARSMLTKPDPRPSGPGWSVAEAAAGETGAGEIARRLDATSALGPFKDTLGRSIWPDGQEIHSRSDRKRSRARRRLRKRWLVAWSVSFKSAIPIDLIRRTTIFPVLTRTVTSQRT